MSDRYARQKRVDGIGEEGQRKIAGGKVLIVGCGALGSVIGMNLAGAGVGRIGLVDFDTVDITNLHRQLFYTEEGLGKSKLSCLASSLRGLNSEVEVVEYGMLLRPDEKGRELVREGGYGIIVDATDNPASKLGTDKLAEELGIACCIGGVEGFRGQVMTILPSDPRYRDVFAMSDAASGLTPCSMMGVVGPVAGAVACVQATEVLKFLVGLPLLSRQILDLDLLTHAHRHFRLTD